LHAATGLSDVTDRNTRVTSRSRHVSMARSTHIAITEHIVYRTLLAIVFNNTVHV
jgi:hypothetical protein